MRIPSPHRGVRALPGLSPSALCLAAQALGAQPHGDYRAIAAWTPRGPGSQKSPHSHLWTLGTGKCLYQLQSTCPLCKQVHTHENIFVKRA